MAPHCAVRMRLRLWWMCSRIVVYSLHLHPYISHTLTAAVICFASSSLSCTYTYTHKTWRAIILARYCMWSEKVLISDRDWEKIWDRKRVKEGDLLSSWPQCMASFPAQCALILLSWRVFALASFLSSPLSYSVIVVHLFSVWILKRFPIYALLFLGLVRLHLHICTLVNLVFFSHMYLIMDNEVAFMFVIMMIIGFTLNNEASELLINSRYNPMGNMP